MSGGGAPQPSPLPGVRASVVLTVADYRLLQSLCVHYSCLLGYPLAQAQLIRGLIRLTAAAPVLAVHLERAIRGPARQP